MALTGKDWLYGYQEACDLRVAQGAGPGPKYHGKDTAPLIWGDQFLGQELSPTGTLSYATFEPLRVGATQSSIDLVVVASHGNAGTLLCPSGSSITIELYQSDTPDGTYESSGYSATITNAEARNVEPDEQICRMYIGNMTKAWMRPKITFTGVFAGGTVDVGLARSVR